MNRGGRSLGLFGCALAGLLLGPRPGQAQETEAAPPQRPAILFHRWEEDWSVLADPDTPREPLDSLKYIPLSPSDPKTYLSLGLNVRERFEANDAVNFGVGGIRNNDYDISRVEAHADLRLGTQVQVFTQLQSDFAPGKTILTPVDQDRLGLEQAFVTVTEPFEDGTFRFRLGRQQLAFDMQRFISVRDGPNIRQSYDAAWAEYERGAWRAMGFYSLPVQNRDLRAFDDYSSDHLTYGGVRLERRLFGSANLSASYARYSNDNAHYLTVKGREQRDVFDVHSAGSALRFDWDVEGMAQSGRIAGDDIQAWAVGSILGYSLRNLPLAPRLGVQVDAASGDSRPNDHRLETFNPLFPNGYYENLGGYTGYVNFISVKPSVTISPTKTIKLSYGRASQWRETTEDAVYVQPNIPIAGTAGKPGRYTGAYDQLIGSWAASRHITLSLEANHFVVSDVIRRAGGHDSNYLGTQVQFGW